MSQPNQERPVCFIVCPIGGEDSDARRRSDRLLKFILLPELEQYYEVKRADRIAETGRITTQIITLLGSSDLVVADITDTNPNVMYELGIRHATGRPTINMALKGQSLPFDVADFRSIFYELDLEEVEAARTLLRAHVDAVRHNAPEMSSVHALISPATTPNEMSIKDAIIPLHESMIQMLREMVEIKSSFEMLVSTLSNTSTVSSEEEQKNQMIMSLMGTLLPQAMSNPDKFARFFEVVQKMGSQNANPPGAAGPGKKRR